MGLWAAGRAPRFRQSGVAGRDTRHRCARLEQLGPLINVGLRRSFGDRFKLLASVGTGFTNGAESTRLIAYLGVQVLLGKESHDSRP